MSADHMEPELSPEEEEQVLAHLETNGATAKRVRVEDEKPKIKLSHELAENIDSALYYLALDDDVFSQGPQLVHVTRAKVADDEGPARDGTPLVRPLALATLRERLTRAVTCMKYVQREGRYVNTLPSEPLIQGLAARGAWSGVRALRGIIEAPGMRSDGSLIQEPGYDASTGFYFASETVFPEVPEAPTQADAARALVDLNHVFQDFPFDPECPEPSRMVPVAALLTLLARPAIDGAVPGFVFDATVAGTGKTLCADAVCIIATGRPCPRTTFPVTTRGKIDDEELRKIVTAIALSGTTVLGFDNIDRGGTFGGSVIDMVLTSSSTIQGRILGTNEMPILAWNAVLIATGNNMDATPETIRRLVWCRMVTDKENPTERTEWTHDPLLPWVEAERPRLVGAALTILRAFVVAGRPNKEDVPPRASFDAWSNLVARAIVFAGGANVNEARPPDAAANPDVEILSSLLYGWAKLAGEGLPGMTAKAALDALYPAPREHDPPDGHEALRAAIEAMCETRPGEAPSTVKLGRCLRQYRQRIHEGRSLDGRTRQNAVHWQVRRR